MTYIIEDWSGQNMFPESTWQSFESAENFLCIYFDKEGMDYEEWRGEYCITEEIPTLKFNYTEWMA